MRCIHHPFLFSLCYLYPRYTSEQPSVHNHSAPKVEFSEPSPPSSSSYELNPGFTAMVRKWPFSGEINDPYEHLEEFEELCLGLVILGMIQKALWWKLFPFSLTEMAEQWYTCTIENMSGDWEELRDDFCYSFSHRTHRFPTNWHPRLWAIRGVYSCNMG